MEHTPTTTLERQLIARAAALRRPVSGSLELTPLCNMNCRMCYVRLSPRQARAAGTLRTGQQWADFFARHKPRRVNITLYGADNAAYETLCRCPGGFEKALAAVRLLRARGVDVKLNGSGTPENVGEMDRRYAIACQLDVPMHMDAYMMPGGAGATALTERTAGTARLPWARWAAGIRTAGSSGSDRMRGGAEGRSTPHFLWQKCCPALAGAGRAC